MILYFLVIRLLFLILVLAVTDRLVLMMWLQLC